MLSCLTPTLEYLIMLSWCWSLKGIDHTRSARKYYPLVRIFKRCRYLKGRTQRISQKKIEVSLHDDSDAKPNIEAEAIRQIKIRYLDEQHPQDSFMWYNIQCLTLQIRIGIQNKGLWLEYFAGCRENITKISARISIRPYCSTKV